MKACTWQRFPAALFIKLLKAVFDYIDDILILIIQMRVTFQSFLY